LNDSGYKFRTGWHGERTITVYTPKQAHQATPNFVYGGLIASLIDCHGTGSASLALHRKNGHEPGDGVEPPRIVTASLKVDFDKPTPLGVPLQAIGTIEEIHLKRWKVTTEVFAEDKLCAKGEVVGVVMPDTFLQN